MKGQTPGLRRGSGSDPCLWRFERSKGPTLNQRWNAFHHMYAPSTASIATNA